MNKRAPLQQRRNQQLLGEFGIFFVETFFKRHFEAVDDFAEVVEALRGDFELRCFI